jgi:diketogulonate reductase-like aldo/keto reductase
MQAKPGEVQAAVKTAIEAGCRLIDCAYVYGNESEVGEALSEVISHGTVRREDVFVVSKVLLPSLDLCYYTKTVGQQTFFYTVQMTVMI